MNLSELKPGDPVLVKQLKLGGYGGTAPRKGEFLHKHKSKVGYADIRIGDQIVTAHFTRIKRA